MLTSRPRSNLRSLLVVAAALVFLCGSARFACGLTQDSPEVKAAVKKAAEYLKTASAGRVGGEALVGLALLKSDVPPDHPKIVSALNAVRGDVNRSKLQYGELYTPAVFITFLTELDAEKYAPEIRKLISFLESSARPYGGWGYPKGNQHDDTADTSMTQYVLLALWEADQSEFDVSSRVVENAAVWLAKTQDPSGGFGYQGIVPASAGPVQQGGVSVSLTTAGLCSIYLAEDILGLLREKKREDDGTPAALTKVADKAKKAAKKTSLARTLFLGVQGRSNAWLTKNLTFNITYYQYYFAYIYERYWALRVLGGDKPTNDWYTWVAGNLLDKQGEDGSWTGHHGNAIETAFCVLCLVRSMDKAIKRDRTFGTGRLVGGRGLPKDSDLVQIRDGKVVSKAEASAVENLLQDIGKAKQEDYEKVIGAIDDLPPDEVKALVSQQAARLRQLAGGTTATERLAAVKALSRAGTLDDVPTFIYVLTDPENEIVLAARDGLRRISRKISGFQMPDDFDEGDRQSAIGNWKAWYLAIRPDAEFEN
jgi:prenyltransferase/squalene oxidase-like repeat protein